MNELVLMRGLPMANLDVPQLHVPMLPHLRTQGLPATGESANRVTVIQAG